MLLRRLIGEKVALEVKHGRDLWPVKADISQFEQVVVNLAVNARDAMPDGGKLIGAHHQRHRGGMRAVCDYKGMPAADYVLIEVADTGTGIPPEIIDKIFEPFFSTKEVGKGTGLGPLDGLRHRQADRRLHLSGIRRSARARRSASSCRAMCRAPRRWRTRCRGPKRRASPARNPRPMRRRAPRRSDRAGHHPAGRGRGRPARAQRPRAQVARLHGDRGRQRRRGDRGARERGGKVDLVVSDVVMPEMDGPTLLKELRKRNPELKIIFVSGYAEEAFEKSLPAGEQVRVPAQAVHAQAAGRAGEGDDDGVGQLLLYGRLPCALAIARRAPRAGPAAAPLRPR